VKVGERRVFDLETGISLATNPVLTFSFVPQSGSPAVVEVHDSENGAWTKAFALPGATN
jgi:sulfur-oxidizing protein SoxY